MKPEFNEEGHAITSGNLSVYYYDPRTGEYTGWSNEFINIGVSMPGNSTAVTPGEHESGKVWVYRSPGWKQEEDHRGEVSYSTISQQEIVIDYIGSMREGFTLDKPSTIFDKWDGIKWVTDTDAQKAAQIVENTNRKAALIAEATVMIAPLQDAKDGGYIDDEDIPVLTAWQKYRYALTKVDPSNPSWPERPGQ